MRASGVLGVGLAMLGLACGGVPDGERAAVAEAPGDVAAPSAGGADVAEAAPPGREYDPASFETLRWGAQAPMPPLAASSSLPPEKKNSYGPENVADDSPFTAWVEGAPDDGVGEWIELRVPCSPPDGKSARLVVFDGYQKSLDSFEKNGLVKELAVAVDGADHGRVSLADVMGPQEFPIRARWGQTVRLTITAARPGAKWRDTAISEVFVDCREEPLPDPGPADPRCCVIDYPESTSVKTGITLTACEALAKPDYDVVPRWSAGRVCETVCCRTTTYGLDGPSVRHERTPRGACGEQVLVTAEVVPDANCR